MKAEADVVVIGAGPCGLFQVFELGLLGLRALVIDSLNRVGGQCMELYPDKPIFDIPALPVCNARELIERLQEQIRPFRPVFHLGHVVAEVEKNQDGSFRLLTAKGLSCQAGAVIVAGGCGAFQPRKLKVAGAEKYEGKCLHYKVADAAAYAGKRVVILGGGDSALDWTLNLYDRARELALVHRREEFRAAPASVERMKQLADRKKLRYVIGRVRGLVEEAGRLVGIRISEGKQEPLLLPLDELLVFYGLSPKLGPIAEWGLQLERNQIRVDTEKFQTSVPGIFAVGDVNVYPGKKKLILSGFHEAALAAFAAEKYIYPEKKQYLQYTTTSTVIRKRLGVAAE